MPSVLAASRTFNLKWHSTSTITAAPGASYGH
jgi:hypothetical protein